MLKLVTFAALILLSSPSWSNPTTPTGIVLDTPWKVALQEFALKNVVHASWGYSHAERNYHNTKWIAQKEQLEIDEDVLFAAAFLHDVGGLPGFEKEGVDHGVRSVEVGIPLLRAWNFPEEKISLVEEVILGHVYYGPKPVNPMVRAFRDADILDFLGTMGVARIMAATTEMGTYPSVKNSVATLNALLKKLPSELSFLSSQEEGEQRALKTKAFLKDLETYSFGGKAY